MVPRGGGVGVGVWAKEKEEAAVLEAMEENI